MVSRQKKRSLSIGLIAIYGLHILSSCGPISSPELKRDTPPRPAASRLSESQPLTLPPDTLVPTETAAGRAVGLLTGALKVTSDGAASYVLPLWVPPGRAGMQPDLSLAYHSRGGNGLLGVGWNLSGGSRITRCSPTPAQDNRTAPLRFNNSDHFCLDGNRLVLMSGTHGSASAEYRTEVDQFTRVTISSATDKGPSQFEVRHRDGRILRYGSTAGSILEGPRAQLVPAPPTGVSVSYPSTVRYAWALSEVRDSMGNFMRMQYAMMPDAYDGHAVEQFPTAIEYTGSDADIANYGTPRRCVEFHYETNRPDKEVQFVSGLKLKTARRLARIDMWAPSAYAGTSIARMRSYVLNYHNESISRRSLLYSIQECDGQGVCRRPLEFEWNLGRDGENAGFYEHINTNITEVAANGWVRDASYPGGYNTTATDFWTALPADINGDGRDDLLYRFSGVSGASVSPPEWRFRLSTGSGFGAAVRATNLPKALVGDALEELLTVDMDMDGKTDVIGLNRTDPANGLSGHYQLYRSTGSSFAAAWNPSDEIYDFYADAVENVVPPAMQVGDLNGDGLPDVLRGWKGHVSDAASPTFWAFRLNTLATTGSLTFSAPYTSLGIRGSADHVGFATDVDGDGAAEVLLRKPDPLPSSQSKSPDGFAGYFTAVGVTPEGSLRESETKLGALPWDFPYAPPYHSRQQWLVDVNGDGLPDALSIVKEARVNQQPTGRTLFLAINTGVGFLPPREIALPPGSLPGPSQLNGGRYIDNGVRIFDFNSDGKQDLLLMDKFQDRGVSRSNLTVLESTGNGFTPRVLTIPVGWSTGPGGNAYPDSQPGSGFGYRLSRLMDVDGDGLMDIIQAQETGLPFTLSLHVYRRMGSKPDVIAAVRDGNGNRTELAYTSLTDVRREASFYDRDNGATDTCSFPLYCGARAIWAVSRVMAPDGLGGAISYKYSYKGARRDLWGRGWLGFSYQSVENTVTKAKTETWFNNTQREGSLYLWAGLPYRENVSVPVQGSADPQTLTRSVTRQWQQRTSTAGKTHFLCPVYESSTEVDSTWGPLRHIATDRQCDEYGNTTVEDMRVRKDTNSTWEHRFLRQTAYDNWTSSWLIGLPRVVEQTHTVPPDLRNPTSRSTTRTTRYSYCPQEPCLDSNLLHRITVEPGAVSPAEDDLWLKTVFVRESTNQVHQVQVRDRQGHIRTSTVLRDDQERIFPSIVTNSLGHRSDHLYHPGLGVLAVSEDANGVRARWQYDWLGRLRVESAPYRDDGLAPTVLGATSIRYGVEQGMLAVTLTTQGGGESVIVHDRFERESVRRARGFDGDWSYVKTEYDALGRVFRRSLPYVKQESPIFEQFFYDQLNRLTWSHMPGTSIRSVSYMGRNRRMTNALSDSRVVVDPLGQIEESQELKVVGDPQSAITTRYTYAPFGLLESVTDAKGHETVATYDRLGRRRSLQAPDTGLTQTFYDGFGQIREERNALNEVTTFGYDALGRVQTLTSKDGVSRFDWDTAAFGVGRLATSTNERDATDPTDDIINGYGYDALGRAEWEVLSLDGAIYPVDLAYDSYSRLSTVSYPAVGTLPRFAVSYGYTAATGMLESVRNATSGRVYWRALEKNAAGQQVRESFGNGVTSSRRYDARGQLRFIDTQGPTGALQNIAYAYRPDGQLTMRFDALAQVREEFNYDALNRLTQWNVQTPCDRTATAYSYDELGNLTARAVTKGASPATTTERFDYRYGEAGAGPHAVTWLAGETFGYDAKGNQRAWQTGDGRFRQVTYTSFDLPRRLQGHNGLQLDFAYDAHHQRVLKQSASGERTVYMGGLYEKRLTSGGTSHVFHVQANGPVAQVTWAENGGSVSESTFYLHDEHLGSIETVTDATGQVLKRRKYQPFGQRANPANPAQATSAGMGAVRHGFTGHEEDTEVGLINMRGRMYDPRVGRFLTPDPFVQAPFSGQSHNRYSYAFNNPLSFVDPSGFTAAEVRTTVEEGSSSSVLDYLWDTITGGPKDKSASHDEAASRTKAATAQPEPLPGGPPPTPTADLNGSRDMGGVATGVGLALSEIGSGMVKDMLSMNTFNPSNQVASAAFEMGKSILEGAKQGYADDGAFGAVTGGINAVNPFYHLMTAGHMANVAWERGDKVSAGSHGTVATITAIGILVTFVGGGAGVGRSGVVTKKGTGAANGVFHITPDGVTLPKGPKHKIPEGYVENPHRSGSYGDIVNGKFKERLRIDPPTPPGQKGPNTSHYHLDGKGKHYSPAPGDKDPGFQP